MALKTYQTRTLLQVLERQSREVLTVEDKLTQQLAKYFSKLEKQVQKVVEENPDLPANTVSVMVQVILEDMATNYVPLLHKYLLMTEKLSKRHTDEIITLQQKKRLGQKRKATTDVSFKELPLTWLSMKAQSTLDSFTQIINPDAPYKIQQNKMVHDYLKDHALTTSEKTKQRINKDIQEILTSSEKEGLGNKQVAQKIQQKFNQLETWEARRIARTEINAANNLVAHNELVNNDLVDYKMWVATSDNRTRDTHKELNGEITRIGNAFSNGLQFPGDHNGKLSEYINCRCRVIAWIPDYDKVPPTGMDHFRENDCVPLPVDESKQVLLQLPEDVKLFEVRQGYMQFNLGELQAKPLHPELSSLLTQLIKGKGKSSINISNPLGKTKPKSNAEKFRSLFGKMDENNVTVTHGRNLEKPVYLQNGEEVLKPVGITSEELEEFERLYSNILDNALSPNEQKIFDKLMKRLKKNGGYSLVSRDGTSNFMWRGKFTSKERNLLRGLQQKRLDALKEYPINNPVSHVSASIPKAKPKPIKEKPKPETQIISDVTSTVTGQVQKQTKVPMLSPREVKKLSLQKLADYYGVQYKGAVKYEYDGKMYHQFVEEFDGSKLTVFFEDGALKSYAKKGIASPQEIVQEVLQTSNTYKKETDEIWFKNTNQGIIHKFTKSGFDSFDQFTGGYNCHRKIYDRGRTIRGKVINDPEHQIVINPKYFKGAKGKYAKIWEQKEGEVTNWKWTIHHEFAHSSDLSRKSFFNGWGRRCYTEGYREIEREEAWFTEYANSDIKESYAEHGGYVDFMLAHPEEQTKTIKISLKENGEYVTKNINFEEYKEIYPKHYSFFKKLIEEGL